MNKKRLFQSCIIIINKNRIGQNEQPIMMRNRAEKGQRILQGGNPCGKRISPHPYRVLDLWRSAESRTKQVKLRHSLRVLVCFCLIEFIDKFPSIVSKRPANILK